MEHIDATTLNRSVEFIEPWLEERHRQSDIPGLVVAISQLGEVAFQGAFGYADLQNRDRLTTEHVFHVASQSKTFTATAIMQLCEAGELRLSDSLVAHIDDTIGQRDPRLKNVTIGQLLCHSAGLRRDGENASFWEQKCSFPTRDELLAELMHGELVFDANTQMKYSNLGYAALGLIIESISGSSYADYVKTNIVEPLGLTSTSVDQPPSPNDKIPIGYGRVSDGGRPVLPLVTTSAFAPAAGIYSTAADLCRFYDSHVINGGPETILSSDSKKEMQRTHWKVGNSGGIEYGLGIDIGYVNDRRVFGHGGGFFGHNTFTLVDSDDGVVVTVLANVIDERAVTIAMGTMGVIDFFRKHGSSVTNDFKKYECKLDSLWSTHQFVASDSHLVAINPDSWEPFSECEELEHVNKDTFKITRTNGFRSEGEQIEFHIDQGAVQSGEYCGRTLDVVPARNN